MFTNTPAVTIWEKVTVNHAVTYIRHETGAAYWEDTHGENSGKNRSPDDKALILIHASNLGGYLPKPDDRIMRGAIADAQPDPHSLTVTAVQDYRYGSKHVRHIEITAK